MKTNKLSQTTQAIFSGFVIPAVDLHSHTCTLIKVPKKICMEQAFAQTTTNLCLHIYIKAVWESVPSAIVNVICMSLNENSVYCILFIYSLRLIHLNRVN